MDRLAPSSSRVVKEFGTDLRRFIRGRVAGPVADDVYQEVLLRIHRGLPQLSDIERLPGWVYRVARNVIADHHRKKDPAHAAFNEETLAGLARDSTRAPEVPSPDANPDPDVASVVAAWLTPMIGTLPEPHRSTLRAVELEGVSQAELAARLGLSPSGARSRVQRARHALRKTLLACCKFELDARGRVVDYQVRSQSCSCD